MKLIYDKVSFTLVMLLFVMCVCLYVCINCLALCALIVLILLGNCLSDENEPEANFCFADNKVVLLLLLLLLLLLTMVPWLSNH